MTRAHTTATLARAVAWCADVRGPKRMPREDATALREVLRDLRKRALATDPPIAERRILDLWKADSLITSDLSTSDRQRLRGWLIQAQTLAAVVRWPAEPANPEQGVLL